MRALSASILAAALPLLTILGASAAEAQLPRYELHRLEPLETPVGVLDQIRAIDMNHRNQVVGRAHTGYTDNPFHSAVFLFSPETGMVDLDPDGLYLSRADAINDQGVIFGRTGTDHPDDREQTGLFLYRPGEGHDFLDARPHIRTSFWFRDMNNAGEVVGAVYSKRRQQYVPYAYTPSEGWINLLNVDPRLGRGDARAEFINDRGEIAFRTGPFNYVWQWYVLHRDGSFVDLGAFDKDIYHFLPNHERRFSKTGQIVSVFPAEIDRNGSREILRIHSQVYRPGRGKLDIHPPGFKASGGDWISPRGLIGGTLQEGTSRDTLFTYDERRDPKLRVEVTAEDFRELFGGEFRNVIVFDMNDRGEFIGCVTGSNEIWFYFSREAGLLSIDELLTASGGEDFQLMVARRVNNNGHLLLLARLRGAYGPGRWFDFDASNRRNTRTLLLSPLE